jgi:energy-coupling factor transporter ATP-binding protein EcfA2
MATVALRTHKLSIECLKGIRGLDEISLEDKPLTGIFGPNGIGKSTILQALAAAYCPPGEASGVDFNLFFPRLTHDVWNGTKFVIEHTFKAGEVEAKGQIEYRKGAVTTRWTPLARKRPERHVTFIGVKSSLPDLEAYPWHDLRGAIATPNIDAIDNRVREAAGGILNCSYTELATLKLPDQPGRLYKALTRAGVGEYPSVLMGAGEQRLLRLLYAVERSPKNGLILVDEIDLLLHGDALRKLFKYLAKRCGDRAQQLVFTSHREELLALKNEINVRHLYPTNGKHRCYPNSDPDSLFRLTGNRLRPLEIFVEDDVAEAVVSHVAGELGMSRHLQVVRYGAATNCFTILAGLLIKGETCESSLFVLDGDEYLDPAERQKQINRACSGNGADAIAHRATMATRIKDLALPVGQHPEPYIHHLICDQPAAGLSLPEAEIQNAAMEIVNPQDKHGFIYHLANTLGDDRAVQLTRVIPLAAKNAAWAAFTQPVREWLTARKAALNLL